MLVELMVVMLILGVAGSVAVAGVVSGMESSRHSQDRLEALHETQMVIQRVSREIRASAVVNEISGDYLDVEVIRDWGRIRFVYEVDGSQLVERRQDFANEEAKRSDFDTGTFASNHDRVLLDGLVSDVVYTAYGGDGSDLNLDGDDRIRDVRRVVLNVNREVGTGERAREPIEVRTTVWPRNAESFGRE